jgi:hypothetical protein
MSSLLKIHTDTEITISRLKGELYLQGISSITKNGFQSGNSAGFGGGLPNVLDLYIDSDDKEKALKIIQSIINE